MASTRRSRVLVVMGVAGSGKTTVGRALAGALGARFIEGDDHHPARSIDRMRRGIALRDSDRLPWLRELHRELVHSARRGEDVVLACSALKRSYHKILLGRAPSLEAETTVIYLRGDPELLRLRLAARPDHFAGAELLAGQLEALEPPRGALEFDIRQPPAAIVDQVVRRLDPANTAAAPAANLDAALRRRLLQQPGVTEKRSRFGSHLAFHVEGKEFAHFHSPTVVDVRVPRVHQKALRGDPRVTFRPRPSDWIEFEMRTEDDADTVLRLAQAALEEAQFRSKNRPGRRRSR